MDKISTARAVKLRIEELLNNRDKKKYWLAMETGLADSTIDSLMSGKTDTVTLKVVQKIAAAFGMSLKEFFNSSIFDNDNFAI